MSSRILFALNEPGMVQLFTYASKANGYEVDSVVLPEQVGLRTSNSLEQEVLENLSKREYKAVAMDANFPFPSSDKVEFSNRVYRICQARNIWFASFACLDSTVKASQDLGTPTIGKLDFSILKFLKTGEI